jgi:uncharacterized protein YodC (DUF2158 family)
VQLEHAIKHAISSLFRVGDVVGCRGGGPPMTVEDVDHIGRVHCVWFDHAKNLRRRDFDWSELAPRHGRAASA